MNYFKRWQITRRLKRQFCDMSADELRDHQAAAASRIWAFARENSPYYRKLYPQPVPLQDVAPMNRASMMEHFNEINTAGLDRDALVRFRIEMERAGGGSYYDGGYSVGLSSGTSGSRLLTVLSQEERQLYNCLLWARSGIPASVRSFRVLFALRTNNPAFSEISAFGVRLVYVDYFHPASELVDLINRKRLNIIAGPPSLLLMIARESRRINHPIEAVVSYAEVLEDTVRESIQRSFQAPVVQIYQGAEGFIGATCQEGSLHLNEDVLLIEPLDDPAQGPCRVILTDLYRRTQPLIRYRLDDILELEPAGCACGSAFRRIRRIHGRADEVFVLYDRDSQPRYLFPDYVSRAISQSSQAILEYQAIQHAPDRIEIRLLLRDERERAQIEQEVLRNLAWRVERLGAELGEVEFSRAAPERNPASNKMVRITRRFPWSW